MGKEKIAEVSVLGQVAPLHTDQASAGDAESPQDLLEHWRLVVAVLSWCLINDSILWTLGRYPGTPNQSLNPLVDQ